MEWLYCCYNLKIDCFQSARKCLHTLLGFPQTIYFRVECGKSGKVFVEEMIEI